MVLEELVQVCDLECLLYLSISEDVMVTHGVIYRSMKCWIIASTRCKEAMHRMSE